MRIPAYATLGAALIVGCGGGLRLTLVEAAHQRPSNVAVYFTVDDSAEEPVPGLTATDFKIYEDGALVSIDESRQTIINPEVAAEHFTLLLVDMSGSVTESEQVPLIVEAASEFTATLEGHQRVGIFAFDGSEEIFEVQSFTPSAGAGTRGVSRLGSFRTRDPSTNLHGAVIKATEQLTEALEGSDAALRFGTIVVFTDGTDRASRVSYDEMLDGLDEAGFDTFAIGVGNEIDESTLAGIGTEGYVLVQDAAAIKQAFETISQRILGYTQRFYLLSYCSPARAGTHEVTIEAVTAEASGELSYSFDAEGFGPECNPERPPPFDTTGRIGGSRRARGRGRSGGQGVRIQAGASARGGAGAGAGAGAADNPEEGDF